MVTIENAKVYKGGGRRFFTKKAAFNAEAWAMISKKHPCDCTPSEPETGAAGEACWRHGDEKAKRVAERLSRKLLHQRLDLPQDV
jgi:hypothetical protein